MAFIRVLLAACTIALLASGAAARQLSQVGTQDCTRSGILAAISGNSVWSTVAAAITALNATLLVPDQEGNGTLFLPTNAAFQKLGVPVETLLESSADQLLSVLAYHSLLGQGATYRRAQLLSEETIQTDLGILLNESLPLTFTETPGTGSNVGLETVTGVAANNTARVRQVTRYCGYFIYQLDGVLIPAESLAEVPTGLAAALAALPANASAAGGLAAAVAAGDIAVTVDSSASGSDGTTSGSGAGTGVAGGLIEPNADGSLTTDGPALLTGTVTPAANATGGQQLGPGLIFLNGTVEDGTGVDGTATAVSRISDDDGSITLSGNSTDLAGAAVNGTGYDAADVAVKPSNSTAAATGFGSAIAQGAGGLAFAAAGGAVLLDGTVRGGKAVNADSATGGAARGNLGTGPILINGTVAAGKGTTGTAYPVTAISGGSISVDSDNAVDIKDATISGQAYNGTGLKVDLASASGSGSNNGGGAAAGGDPGADSPTASPGSVDDQAASPRATAAVLPLLATAAAVCLMA